MKNLRLHPLVLIRDLRRKISQAIWPGPRTIKELRELIRFARRNNIITLEIQDIVERVLSVSNLQVRDVMVPRALMKTIDLEETFENVLDTVTSSGHSRFPVMKEWRNDVEAEGILLAKDMLAYVNENNGGEFYLSDLLREVMYIPESMRLNPLLKRFQEERTHMAIVVNEYNSIAGLVTIEDVLEQIVGEIEDESDFEDSERIVLLKDDLYEVDAHTEIEEFNEKLNVNIMSDVNTVGGLVLKTAGYVPDTGESFDLNGLNLEIADADERRILLLRVKRDRTERSTTS